MKLLKRIVCYFLIGLAVIVFESSLTWFVIGPAYDRGAIVQSGVSAVLTIGFILVMVDAFLTPTLYRDQG